MSERKHAAELNAVGLNDPSNSALGGFEANAMLSCNFIVILLPNSLLSREGVVKSSSFAWADYKPMTRRASFG
jgi:hypothetical protein